MFYSVIPPSLYLSVFADSLYKRPYVFLFFSTYRASFIYIILCLSSLARLHQSLLDLLLLSLLLPN